ncbi:hypothetical protein F3J38_18330 [Pantoea sp. Acro-805]|uniref:Uncharacterized protein n=1 Tax=Candidatus Pantoea formicae TaxID=2608355 RepID=A0ABX0R1Z6_9GAMM|nr:hypothetical protein [Pantoea formicae]MDF7648190.1 hypothetical protein [Erwiniaceae bacterium L1_54_3]NIF01995.1 hypothetical protein [Pantoea formicae]
MKNAIKPVLITFAILAIGMTYGLHYLKMVFAEGAEYSEKDRRDYDFYTPELLKNIPRITKDFRFTYNNESGPNPALIHQIRFIGTSDTSKIDIYLERNGFKKGGVCDYRGVCWTGNEPNINVSVGIEEDPITVIVSMVDKVK